MGCSFESICIKCDEGENLLLCSENGCPLAIHERCMGCPARFDDEGNFYCPFCLYKQAVAESRQARENAMSKKKDLLIFTNEETKGGEEHLRENNRAKAKMSNQLEVIEANVCMSTDHQGKRRKKRLAILNPSVELDEEHKIRDAEKQNIQEKNSEKVSGSGCLDPSLEIHEEHHINISDKEKIQEETCEPSDQDPSLKMHEECKINDAEEEKVEEETSESSDQDPLLKMNKESKISGAEKEKNEEKELETSVSSSDQDHSHKMHEKQKTSNAEKEKIQEEDNDTSSASSDDDALPVAHVKGKRKFNRSDSIDRDNGVDSVPSKHKKKQKSTTVSTQKKSSTDKELDEKVDASSKSKQPSVKLANDAFMNGRRKRLRWREEEEEMLKVGVKKFSNQKQQNVPWRKILDFGRHVFHETRCPADLKDKWRNMLNN